MADPINLLDDVHTLIQGLEHIGLKPVMVGGMALVILGSQRVTRDFDFVISQPEDRLEDMINLFYDKGLELASRLNKSGAITATIDNKKVAAIRLRLDHPASVYFLNSKTGLRVDLLFDFPLTANELRLNSKKRKIRACVFHVAATEDLIRMKEIAKKSRSKPGDAEDLLFLKELLRG